jgi:hypothetical protein
VVTQSSTTLWGHCCSNVPRENPSHFPGSKLLVIEEGLPLVGSQLYTTVNQQAILQDGMPFSGRFLHLLRFPALSKVEIQCGMQIATINWILKRCGWALVEDSTIWVSLVAWLVILLRYDQGKLTNYYPINFKGSCSARVVLKETSF